MSVHRGVIDSCHTRIIENSPKGQLYAQGLQEEPSLAKAETPLLNLPTKENGLYNIGIIEVFVCSKARFLIPHVENCM